MPTAHKQLRARIADMDSVKTGAGNSGTPPIPLGVPEIDGALPWGGLPRGAVHELMTSDPADGAVMGFLLTWLARLETSVGSGGPILWAGCRDDVDAPGFAALGIDPARLLFARCAEMANVLWAIEEGLRTAALAAIVGEVGPVDFALTRRLQLAAANSGVPLFLLRPFKGAAESSAAVTRWRIGAAPGTHITSRRWRVELIRCRGGRPGHWIMERNDETGALAVVTTPGDRPDRPRAG